MNLLAVTLCLLAWANAQYPPALPYSTHSSPSTPYAPAATTLATGYPISGSELSTFHNGNPQYIPHKFAHPPKGNLAIVQRVPSNPVKYYTPPPPKTSMSVHIPYALNKQGSIPYISIQAPSAFSHLPPKSLISSYAPDAPNVAVRMPHSTYSVPTQTPPSYLSSPSQVAPAFNYFPPKSHILGHHGEPMMRIPAQAPYSHLPSTSNEPTYKYPSESPFFEGGKLSADEIEPNQPASSPGIHNLGIRVPHTTYNLSPPTSLASFSMPTQINPAPNYSPSIIPTPGYVPSLYSYPPRFSNKPTYKRPSESPFLEGGELSADEIGPGHPTTSTAPTIPIVITGAISPQLDVPRNTPVKLQDKRLQYSQGFTDDTTGVTVKEQGSLLSTNDGWEYVIAKKGSYSYVSPEGVPVKVNYIADHNGFRVLPN